MASMVTESLKLEVPLGASVGEGRSASAIFLSMFYPLLRLFEALKSNFLALKGIFHAFSKAQSARHQRHSAALGPRELRTICGKALEAQARPRGRSQATYVAGKDT